MNKKHRSSLIAASISFLFVAGMMLATSANPKNLKSVVAESKSYTLSLVSTSFLNNKRVTTAMGNTVSFSINNIMYFNDWQALAIPSSSGSYEASFSPN